MTGKTLRCAIYTRVSSDAGLEQEFNSLDAQREASEAYIKSQASEGWRLVKDRFDDAGLSGGTMNRPALQNLLGLIEKRRIDIVVVYKVDRLTRSLADFAKLVELFDAHGVCFVSVTQAFNTTTSMGRLTLNVLLSFAQFEREVTGERIRDKIAASRKKGIWMGGTVPFGYRVVSRKLEIAEEEATIIRLIYDLFLQLGSVRAVQLELASRNIRTRRRVLSDGRVIGGIPFTTGPLAVILRNRTYLGEAKHHDRAWPGEHAPIVDRAIFDRVQEELSARRRYSLPDRASSDAPLAGKLFNATGERMSPGYAVKKGVRYHYYVSTSAMQAQPRDASAIHRVAAAAIEEAVATGIGDRSLTMVERVVVHHDRLKIAMRASDDEEPLNEPIVVPWSRRSVVRHKVILRPAGSRSELRPMESEERKRLLRGIATGRKWMAELAAGPADLSAIASRENRSARSVRQILSLGFLDPLMIEAAIAGTLPRGYGLTRLFDLPPLFEDQWRALGLTRPQS